MTEGEENRALLGTANDLLPKSQRMGIVHLLGWTALIAFMLWMRQESLRSAAGMPAGGASAQDLGYELIVAVVLGAELLCVCIAVKRWGEGLSFPTEPGEWLLLIFGINYLLLQLFVPTLLYLVLPLSPEEQAWLPAAITYLLVLPLWTWPLVRNWHSPFRWYFLVQVIRGLCSLTLFVAVTFGGYYAEGNILLYGYGVIDRFGPLLALLYGLWRDREQPSHRGWLHTFGLTLVLLAEATAVGMRFSAIFT